MHLHCRLDKTDESFVVPQSRVSWRVAPSSRLAIARPGWRIQAKTLLKYALAFSLATGVQADNPPRSASLPVPRSDANSRMAHQQLVDKAKRRGIDIYFVGDSITRRWGASDPQYQPLLANWKTNFFGWNAGNFGWGADRIENILWRLQNGELAGVNPKAIVILAGINNVGTGPGDTKMVEDVTQGLKAIVDLCRTNAPHATLILTAIFPRNDKMDAMPTINKINANVERLADGKDIRYININDKLVDSSGRFFPGMMNPDQLHPTVRTYQIWADALRPIFTEILGPPAKEDHAPPPTGDPGVKG